MVYEINSLKETQKLAKKIAKNVGAGDVVLLKGEVGAGKTTIVKFILKALKVKEEAVSPTFAIVKTYKSRIGEINHFDLYRIESVSELYEIGFYELLQNKTSFIEWPEIAGKTLQKNTKEILIEKAGETKRRFSLWF